MKDRKEYEVTELAGPWLAGQRKPADGRLWLTASQAAHELRLGTIRPPTPAEPAPAPARKRTRRRQKSEG